MKVNNSLLFLVSMCFLMPQASADMTKTIKKKVKESIFDELGSEIATIPGFDFLSNKVSSNKIKFIVRKDKKGSIQFENYKDINQITLVPEGFTSGYSIYQNPVVPSGNYTLYLEPKNKSRNKIVRQIVVQNNATTEVKVDFYRVLNKKFPLIINATPKGSKIRVMNIKPKYVEGMKLPLGPYKIEISRFGYKKQLKTVTLDHNNQTFEFNLDKDENLERIVVTGSRVTGGKF
jgi:hypothetical protein